MELFDDCKFFFAIPVQIHINDITGRNTQQMLYVPFTVFTGCPENTFRSSKVKIIEALFVPCYKHGMVLCHTIVDLLHLYLVFCGIVLSNLHGS